MRDDGDRDGGILYIGPRAFVAGFAILCAIFLIVAYGVTRLNESIQSQLPVADVLTPPADVIVGQRVPFISATPNRVRRRGQLSSTAPPHARSAAPKVAPIVARHTVPIGKRTPVAVVSRPVMRILVHARESAGVQALKPVVVQTPKRAAVRSPQPAGAQAFKPAVMRTASPAVMRTASPALARTGVPLAGQIATPRLESEKPHLHRASRARADAGAPPSQPAGYTGSLLVPFTHTGSLDPRSAQSSNEGALLVGRARPLATPSALPATH